MSFALPQVGSIITVTTRYKSNVIGRPEFTETTYENVQVIKPFGWTKPNAFCIPAENEPFIKVRTIPLSMISDLIIHEGEGDVTLTGNGTEFVYVPGSKGKEYMVTVVDGFGVECECLGYTYRKQCKHLKIASTEAA